MATEQKRVTLDVTFLDLLTLLFIGLKVAGIIHWAWIWVLLPQWGVFIIPVLKFVITFGLKCKRRHERLKRGLA